jgi:hypothetical protein
MNRNALTSSAFGNHISACPVCKRPFQEDDEVGPVPACECGTRGKEVEEPFPEPLSPTPKRIADFRLRNLEW